MALVGPSFASAVVASGMASSVPSVLTNAVYRTWEPIWRKLADVYEGSGGFLDGSYLVAHPREWQDYKAAEPKIPTKKLINRRKLARYENLAAPIIDNRRDAIFRERANRSLRNRSSAVGVVGNDRTSIEAWWANVDGMGTSIDQFWYETWTYAAVFGHVFILMDTDESPVTGSSVRTLADMKPPYPSVYTPLDVPDWTVDRKGNLTSVRLVEPFPINDVGMDAETRYDFRVREVHANGWRYYDVRNRRGAVELGTATEGTFNLGRLPVVVLYAKHKVMTPLIGDSVLSRPDLYIDHYNITSEVRDLMRSQTFGYMHVQLPPGYTAKQAKEDMGDEVGVDNALFTQGPLNFVSPDTANVEVHQKERSELTRTIHRITRSPWESDSRDAESADALRTKREDFNLIISGHTTELSQADHQLAELWYRWTQGPDKFSGAMKQDGVSISWDRPSAASTDKEEIEDAVVLDTMEMGPTFEAEMKYRIAEKKLPHASPETLSKIEGEIRAISEQRAVLSDAQRKAEIANPTRTMNSGAPGAVGGNAPVSPASVTPGGAEENNENGTGDGSESDD